MNVLLLNDTRADPNPGCQATVWSLVHHLSSALSAHVTTRPRGDAYEYFADLVSQERAHVAEDWLSAVNRLEDSSPLAAAIADADLVVANLEGTFHHHMVGALALGGALALAHRAGKRVWVVNGTVDAIDEWLLAQTLAQAEYVAVREPRSVRWLQERGLIVTAAARRVRQHAQRYTPPVCSPVSRRRRSMRFVWFSPTSTPLRMRAGSRYFCSWRNANRDLPPSRERMVGRRSTLAQ
jgi:hypothetical protein